MAEKVVVGMSGGVDSSVTAYLLKKAGYEVIGVTMQIWQDEEFCDVLDNNGCCGLSAVDDARRVANSLGIDYFVLNFKQEFKENVIDYFIDEYKQGKTPNPCIACNRYVKWESLLDKALKLGADYIATGHYAKVCSNGDRYFLEKSKTDAKDQTYALYNLTQFQLSKTLMPLGNYEKDEIRAIAKEIGLAVHDKKDSQEICFIPDNDYAKFIEQNTGEKAKPGNFVDVDGKVIGKHNGIVAYTIGQRKGLGAFGKRVYVKNIDVEKNEVMLCNNEELFEYKVRANNLNHMLYEKYPTDRAIIGKIRYSHKGGACTVSYIDDDTIELTFEEPQRAPTKGQAIVLYENNVCLGGGTII